MARVTTIGIITGSCGLLGGLLIGTSTVDAMQVQRTPDLATQERMTARRPAPPHVPEGMAVPGIRPTPI